METYFKIKIFAEYAIPIVMAGLVLVYIFYSMTKSWLKSRLMKKLGYKYDSGLGTNAAYEFQPRWKKDKIKVHYRTIESLNYFKIKDFLNLKEETNRSSII